MTKDDTGTIKIVEHHLPPLLAGEYAVTITQDLSNDDCKDPAAPSYVNEHPSRTRRFAIAGPRFTLDPADLNAVFPPPDNRGEYKNSLAHVVLNGRTLPWVRSPSGVSSGTTWLAVLLFEESDPAPLVKAMRIADLLGDPANRVASYGDAYRLGGGRFATDYGETLNDPCQAIDVPLVLFNKIAPSLDDLAWLAHSRTVNAAAKAGQTTGLVDLGVVIGNRLPQSGTRCTAHLVSFERMADFLPSGPDYVSKPILFADGTAATTIRLASLAHWSFTSIDPKESFQGYLEHVSVGALQRTYTGAGGKGAGETVSQAFAMGYTAIDHQTRLGDRTVSWYRGPFVPFPVSGTITVPLPDPLATPPSEGPSSADALVRYDPGTQMMDVTYASAWQLGRMLALQDEGFSVALYNWKRSVAIKTAVSIERQFIDELSGGGAAGVLPQRASALHAAAAVLKTAFAGPFLTPRHTGRRHVRILPRKAAFERTAHLVSNVRKLAKVHADTPVPPDIVRWLGQLRLLHGVPFHYLVPDEAMLPAESIRFFQLDENWIISLLEGAFSIGRSTSGDAAHDLVLAPKIHTAARNAALELRAPQSTRNAASAISGFLLRSAAVSGWPGLEAHAADANGPIDIVRMDRLAPDILLFMAAGVLTHVQIQEPPEGLHFGVDLDKGDKSLRYITVPAGVPHDPGDQIDDAPSVTPPMRDNRVFKVTALKAALETAVRGAGGYATGDFTAAEFALEMVEGVQAVIFKRR
jgi:hypothetical protein